jgi:hypothetical protein
MTAFPAIWNFRLIAEHRLGGFGGMGEGMSIQIAPDGRRILWLAHESAPKNFTAVDVSDPRQPKVVVQTDLPEAHMRSNSLEVSGKPDGGRLSVPEARTEARRVRAVRHFPARGAALAVRTLAALRGSDLLRAKGCLPSRARAAPWWCITCSISLIRRPS